MNCLRNYANEKIIPENENLDKSIDIVENIFDYNKQLKDKWQKILTLKQMLQRLSVAPSQITASNTGKICLNEICQIIYFFVSSK